MKEIFHKMRSVSMKMARFFGFAPWALIAFLPEMILAKTQHQACLSRVLALSDPDSQWVSTAIQRLLVPAMKEAQLNFEQMQKLHENPLNETALGLTAAQILGFGSILRETREAAARRSQECLFQLQKGFHAEVEAQIGASQKSVRTSQLLIESEARPIQSLDLKLDAISYAVAVSPHNDLFAVGLEDSRILLKSLRTGETIQELKGPSAKLQSLSFSSDGKYLAASFDQGPDYVWRLESNSKPLTLKLKPFMRLWHLAHRLVNHWKESPSGVALNSAREALLNPGFHVFTPDNSSLITLHSDGVPREFSLMSGKITKRFDIPKAERQRPVHLDISSDSKYLVAVYATERTEVWNLATGQWLHASILPYQISSPFMARLIPGTTKLLLTFTETDGLVIWDYLKEASSGKNRTELQSWGFVLDISPGGRYAVLLNKFGARLTDLKSDSMMDILMPPSGNKIRAAFSQDGSSIIVSAGHQLKVLRIALPDDSLAEDVK